MSHNLVIMHNLDSFLQKETGSDLQIVKLHNTILAAATRSLPILIDEIKDKKLQVTHQMLHYHSANGWP